MPFPDYVNAARVLRQLNDDGRPFHVRVVLAGDRYGLAGCLTHPAADPAVDPLVEWYDASADPQRFGELGQFVSRYRLSTLTDTPAPGGLNLHGGVPVWQVSAVNVAEACGFARGLTAGL